MKLGRLESTTQHHSADAVERAHLAASEPVRRVEAMEGVEGDRQRSIQQEISEVDPRAIGDFEGAEQVMKGAREVAAKLTMLGSNASGLVKLQALSRRYSRIDDKV